MSNGKSMRDIAERRVAAYIRDHIDEAMQGHAEDLVDLVIETLEKPDKAMLDAGRAELRLAMPPQVRTVEVTALAGTTWRAMLNRAH